MIGEQTAIIPAKPDVRAAVELATFIRHSIVELRRSLLKPGTDYGKIPGTSKDVLLKPGAEKLSSSLKLYPVPKLLTCVEDWENGFFFYRYQIDLMHRETGEIWGSGIGSCNSREKKYAWRWVTESELPAGMDKDSLLKEDGMQTLTEFAWAVDKSETGGKWGKPAEHWQMFKDAIASGTAKKIQKELKDKTKKDAWEITSGVARYRIPNPEICDLVNTVDKMAYKRAYVAATLIATNASEFFTQDMEDFMDLVLPDDDVIEGVVVEVETTPAEQKQEEQKPAPFAVSDAYKEGYQAGKSDAPRMAGCLKTDKKCQEEFAKLLKELGIANGNRRYLEYLSIQNYSDYSDVDGTFENLCLAMRNLHARFKQEDAQLEADMVAQAAAQIPPAQAAQTLAGDHSRISANPTGAASNGGSGAATGATSASPSKPVNGRAAGDMSKEEQALANKELAAVTNGNDDIPADPGNPNRVKRPAEQPAH